MSCSHVLMSSLAIAKVLKLSVMPEDDHQHLMIGGVAVVMSDGYAIVQMFRVHKYTEAAASFLLFFRERMNPGATAASWPAWTLNWDSRGCPL